jgi:uroporphyrinogen-III synthase
MPASLDGFVIGVTADSRSEEQISLFENQGAVCLHGPAVRTDSPWPEGEILEATTSFLARPADVVVLNADVGLRGWLGAADSVRLGSELQRALSSAQRFSFGPRVNGTPDAEDLEMTGRVPSGTPDEVIERLQMDGVNGKRVAVQLEPVADGSLVKQLEALGAEVVPIPMYRSTMPDDLGPAQSLIRWVCDERVDAVTFETRPAVENFMAIAMSMGRWDHVVEACEKRVQIFCGGPMCAQRATNSGMGIAAYPDRAGLAAMAMLVTKTLGEQSTTVRLGGFETVLKGRTVSVRGGEPAVLAGRERQVLDALLERPGAVCSKNALMRSIWGRNETDTHVVEVTVGRLRRRLGAAGGGIETVIRRGYRINSE